MNGMAWPGLATAVHEHQGRGGALHGSAPMWGDSTDRTAGAAPARGTSKWAVRVFAETFIMFNLSKHSCLHFQI